MTEQVDSPLATDTSVAENDGTTAPEVETPAADPEVTGEETLSKRQRKRLAKQEKWNEVKLHKRAMERERKKKRLREAKERGEEIGPSRKKLKQRVMADSDCKIKVAVDCSFDDLMSDKGVKQTVHQLQYCYATNRRATNPLQLYFTSISGKTLARLESIGEYKGWDINVTSEDYSTVFGKDKVVYLTSDSDNVLQTLDEDKAYIIGGLVDHNNEKGLCHRLAEEKGIAHARLPIGEFLNMKTRKVLTINHVFDILLNFTESGSWEEAFFKVIPKRKGAIVKSQESQQEKPKDSEGDQANSDAATEETNVDSVTEPHVESNELPHSNEGSAENETCQSSEKVSDNGNEEATSAS